MKEVKDLYVQGLKSTTEIAQLLGISAYKVGQALRDEGVFLRTRAEGVRLACSRGCRHNSHRPDWTNVEIAILTRMYSITPTLKLMAILQRSQKAIGHKAERLGLKKTEEAKFAAMSEATKQKVQRGCFKQVGAKLKQLRLEGKITYKPQRGPQSPNWKGELRKVPERRLRVSVEFKEWRDKVFTRDSYTCQLCGQVGHQLHAHHIHLFSRYTEFRYFPQNGITLCKSCHKKIRQHEQEYEAQFRKIVDTKHGTLVIPKVWGFEVQIVNCEYAAKLLLLRKSAQSSLHSHPLKKESFACYTGKVRLIVEEEELILKPGEPVVTIYPGMKHTFLGLEDSVILEISTHDDPEDCVRFSISQAGEQ